MDLVALILALCLLILVIYFSKITKRRRRTIETLYLRENRYFDYIQKLKKNKRKVEEKYQDLKEKYRKLQTTVKELRQNGKSETISKKYRPEYHHINPKF